MKEPADTDDLRTLLELCNDHRVAKFEKSPKHMKIVFYPPDGGSGFGAPLDSGDDSGDLEFGSPPKPLGHQQPEGPYPDSIFPDGEAPTFGD